MSSKEVSSKEVDWDTYFERRQRVRHDAWKRWYDNNISLSNDKEMMRQYLSMLLHMLEIIKTPEGNFGNTITSGGVIDREYEIKVSYYEELYNSFKFVWWLRKSTPVAIFLKNELPEIVRRYYLRLTNQNDRNAQIKAQDEATKYVSSYLGQKEVVNWLAYNVARERIKKHLVSEENINTDFLSMKPIDFDEDAESEQIIQPLKRGRKKTKSLPYIPKTQSTFKQWYKIGQIVIEADTKSNTETLKEVFERIATDLNVSSKTVERAYNLKQYINKNCPIDIRTDLNKIQIWLISLDIS